METTDGRSDQKGDPDTVGPTPEHDDCHSEAGRWSQATTVGYANEGLTLYFLCGPDSQKAMNLARDDRVSLTIDHDTPQVMEITGLSMAAHTQVVTDPKEGEKALRLLMQKYPQQDSLPLPMPTPEDVRIFRVTPTVISVLDYSEGFGHTDLVTC
jgi:nitroimidazol reductase NimA-like FMN-containing flavoprotein (pyridoxamine 5'-phosphate oxidase superfamily)